MSKKNIFLITFFVLLAIAFMGYAGYVIKGEQGDFFGREKLPVLGTNGHIVGGFSFTNQEGRTITARDVEGKIYVAEYFFTTCTGICPKMNKNMVKVYAKYKSEPKFRILSHTVDPENDSVPVLKKYAEEHGADPANWWFLTGSKKELYKLARQGYLVDDGTYAGDEDFVHTQWFALVDGQGRIRGLYEGTKATDVDKLIVDIDRLLKE
ncbi:SCO family protein [Chitinophaga sancti]|uniref:Protein SCO1/2 n=1 Tax=Chitinophaga sancti TaxID=1004 RepID=A0A1K1NXC8_9BACT|nr:SCO family protein [Chitinophaga sancti]WQD60269.1 SCO family protein [Chitinophaga sancti]WQG87603.1 SCO family protein [Chitinophaga sancti]SFW39921.1 protein SCO1/2 [Chitinophaga sancti]